MKVTVIIPTHNPRRDILEQTLAALRKQTLKFEDWELLVIDNCSVPPLPAEITDWHPHGRVMREETLGLTAARIKGTSQAQGEILVWCDDDNLLAPNYLSVVLSVFRAETNLGAAGGKSLPVYEVDPPEWYSTDLAPIGCRDLGNQRIDAEWTDKVPRTYPACAPIGAGMAIRSKAMMIWQAAAAKDQMRFNLGRTGTALTSGEDNDINLTLLAAGWILAYLPELQLTHVIPAGRLSLDYQKRIARATFYDFVRVLALHGITPWPPVPRWATPFLKMRAWWRLSAWSGPAASIRWHGVCGQIDGRVCHK